MKKLNTVVFVLILVLTSTSVVHAQNELRVPLSNPDKPGKLSIHSVNAEDIVIRVHESKDVLIQYEGEERDREQDKRKDGMRRISSSGLSLEVVEDDNEVKITTAPNSSDLQLEVWVPKMFSLSLHLVQGDLEVYNIQGEIDVNAVNGNIEMIDVGGSALVNSVNGDLELSFSMVDQNAPMSFTTVNGDIDLSLPEDSKFTAKMKTEWGDIYTNFEMEIDESSSPNQISNKDGKYKVSVNKWVYGKINGGGAEYLFKTLHGDISIRKKE